MNHDITAEIQRRAYLIWERENRPEGKQLDHWFCAEAEVEAANLPMVIEPASGPMDPVEGRSARSAPKAGARRTT